MPVTNNLCLWHVDGSIGSDNNSGGFVIGSSSSLSTLFTDGAATNANTASPVFTSASYTFTAGDVGAWIFIANGTNWLRGRFYRIVSVAAGAATLAAGAQESEGGNGIISSGGFTYCSNELTGCATVASPTGATWHLDYSRTATARYTYTDLVIDAVTNTKVTSAANPFTQKDVGNVINITGGTGFTVDRYVIHSVAAGVATLNSAVGTLGATGGTGTLGGCLASPGLGTYLTYRYQTCFCAGGQTYLLNNTTPGATGSILTLRDTNINKGTFKGFYGNRTHIPDFANLPIFKADGITNTTLVGLHSISGRHDFQWLCMRIDGSNATGVIGIGRGTTGSNSFYRSLFIYCHDCPAGGITAIGGADTSAYCCVYNCGSAAAHVALSNGFCYRCLVIKCPCGGVVRGNAVECIAAYSGVTNNPVFGGMTVKCVAQACTGIGAFGSIDSVFEVTQHMGAGDAFSPSLHLNTLVKNQVSNSGFGTNYWAFDFFTNIATEPIQGVDATPPHTNGNWTLVPDLDIRYPQTPGENFPQNWTSYFGYSAMTPDAAIGAIFPKEILGRGIKTGGRM